MKHHYKAFVKKLYFMLHGDEEEVYLCKIGILERRIVDLTVRLSATTKLYDNLLERHAVILDKCQQLCVLHPEYSNDLKDE